MQWKRLTTMALFTAVGVGGRSSLADDTVRAVHYDLGVTVGDSSLTVRELIRLSGRVPSKLTLDLVPEMKVLAVRTRDKDVPFTVGANGIELDTSSLPPTYDDFTLALSCQGAPREQFPASRGGFLRSAVGADVTYVRSQVPWYARVAGSAATYRTVVDVKSGWLVRTAGVAGPVVKRGERDVFTFDATVPERDIGLVAGRWAVREIAAGDGTVFDAFHLTGNEKGADALLAAAKRVFDFYGAWLGKAPLARFTLVEMPETFGASSGYGESGYDLLGPGAFASTESATAVPLVAHEVAHTWWGHAVTFSDWPSEALASFAATRFLAADQGEDAARSDRRASVEEFVRFAESGGQIQLADIRGFGEGLDAATYANHAYGKGKMLLVMLEQTIGEPAMKKLLASFLDASRGRSVGWTELRAALVAAGRAAKVLVEQWETPGIPRLSLDLAKSKSGRVAGTLRQEGTAHPYRMKVVIAAKCGEKLVATTVALDGADAKFEFAVPSEPSAVLVDPDWLLLAARPAPAGAADTAKLLDEALIVANDPKQDDPKLLEGAIAQLRTVLDSGSPDVAGTCHVGIGRCLFNLCKLDEAKKELEEGLRAGTGPFHRGWANLRLGNIADLQKRRAEAVKFYEIVVAGPAAKNLEFTKGKARAFLEKPYRGLAQDG